MKNKNVSVIKLLPVVMVALLLNSCKKFLDESPSKTSSLVVKTAAQLSALLDNYGTFYSEDSGTEMYSTDDCGITVSLYDGGRGAFRYINTIQYLLWDIPYLPETTGTLWTGEYQKIFTANLALNNLDKVSGTDAEKEVIRTDACFVRAYSYWILANTYCLPYTEANKNEPGLPIKNSTSFDEPMARQPLEKVYQQIEADLAVALKTTVSLTQSGRARHWRASKAGVNAFAARYYLNRNDNVKAITYADAALADYSTLVDYNTEMRYGLDQSVVIDPGTPNAQKVVLKYPYTHDNTSDMTDIIGWKEFLYFRVLNNGNWWYIPSTGLLNLYDKTNDLRYQYHIVEGYSYDRGMTNPSYDYPGYIFFYKDKIPSGPTVAEVLLIKAEAQARTNDPSGAMATLNRLRAKRMKPGPWVNLTASGKEDAIKKVTEERRREMPFVQRWFDIRRYNNNDDPNDDVVLSRDFYPYTTSNVLFSQPVKTYTLPVKSRRFAVPLPLTEIISSNGVIEQNKY